MTLKVQVEGPSNKTPVRVTDEGAAVVTFTSALPVDEDILIIPFASPLTIDGIPLAQGGSSALNVNGSLTTPIDAFITGQSAGDLYITTANAIIADDGAVALNKFGSLAALTNGIQLFYSIPQGRQTLSVPIKTNLDFIRIGTKTAAMGSKNDAFQLANADGNNNDAYNPVLDLSTLSPLGVGVRLRQNSNDKIGISIRDNLTGIATFNIILTGYIRLPQQ